MKYWLIKTEPTCFGIDDLINCENQTEHWDGVRNYQARNMMQKEMQVGDQLFFYHSNCKPPGIVGIAEVASESYPDHTAFNPDEKHYDPKSDPDKPRWYMVDVKFKRKLKREISLDELRTITKLSDMFILRKGNRLSITPVTQSQWNTILQLESEV